MALELGYSDRPRSATCADVAAELGSTSATGSEHVQKAEMKVVRAAMGEFGPRAWADPSRRSVGVRRRRQPS
ncbi:helix-turn-helix domain-containing protein [Natrinema halophilum]|uniref:helix-turn-helix domain-containing protein n=1 Tax=Natrinema halophilum TaxID=1699371 RepID=UPI001C528A38